MAHEMSLIGAIIIDTVFLEVDDNKLRSSSLGSATATKRSLPSSRTGMANCSRAIASGMRVVTRRVHVLPAKVDDDQTKESGQALGQSLRVEGSHVDEGLTQLAALFTLDREGLLELLGRDEVLLDQQVAEATLVRGRHRLGRHGLATRGSWSIGDKDRTTPSGSDTFRLRNFFGFPLKRHYQPLGI